MPAELPQLKNLGKFENSPHAITNIRNSIIHPKQKADISSQYVTECSDLAIWCYEILILKILDYEGKYQNRLQTHVNYMNIPDLS